MHQDENNNTNSNQIEDDKCQAPKSAHIQYYLNETNLSGKRMWQFIINYEPAREPLQCQF